jgi:hypothetical protein
MSEDERPEAPQTADSPSRGHEDASPPGRGHDGAEFRSEEWKALIVMPVDAAPAIDIQEMAPSGLPAPEQSEPSAPPPTASDSSEQ